MPKTPTYDQPQVKSQGLPGVSVRTRGVSADAFGAIQGEQLQQAGKIGERIITEVMKLQEQRDVADGLDAATRLSEESRQKQQEFASRKGKDALTVQKEFGEWHRAKQQEIAGQIKSDRARQLFEKKAKQVFASDDDWAFNYQKQQDEVYYTAKIEASVTNATQSALYNPTTENINTQLGEISRNYGDMALRKGYDADWIKSKVTGAEQKIHGDILQNAMEQDALGSVQSYLGQYGDKIDPGLRGKAENWAKDKEIDAASRAFADDLIAQGVDFDDAVATVREKFAGEDEDKYLARVRSRYVGEKSRKAEQSKAISKEIHKEAYKVGGYANLPDERIDALAEVDPKEAIRLKKAKEREQENVLKGNSRFAKHSDPDAYVDIVAKISDTNEITSKEDLEPYAASLTQGDYLKFVRLIDKESRLSYRDALSAYKQYLPKDQRDPAKWDQARNADFSVFWSNAQETVKDAGDKAVIHKLAGDHHREVLVNGTGYFNSNYGREKTTLGSAAAEGLTADQIEVVGDPVPRNELTEPGYQYEERKKQQQQEKPQFMPGQRVKQGGITYEFDGKTWNPVE